MKRFTKIISGIAALSAATLAWASPTFAWGPERPTYTNANPADHVVFNSITDNAAIGDERNFVRVRDMSTNDKYSDEVKVVPGGEYEVYIFYHNDASGSLNPSGKGIANGVKVASSYPTKLVKGERGMISGIIDTTDGDPKSVWDEAYLTTDSTEQITMRYKTGSAVIHNAGKVNGSVLSTKLFTEGGTYIGINVLDGRIPGCAEYSGYITYTLVAEDTSSTFEKKVSTDGQNWQDVVTVKPGEIVTYKVTFTNTGNTTLANTIFKDIHDSNLTLVAGSIKVFDKDNPNGKVINDILDISGYNVGDVVPNALVQIIYQAQVTDTQEVCNRTLPNKIAVRYNAKDQGEDDANVRVVCDPIVTDFEFDKKVSLDGQNWLDNIKAKPGDVLTFKLTYKNSGGTGNALKFSDALGKGMEYVQGSSDITVDFDFPRLYGSDMSALYGGEEWKGDIPDSATVERDLFSENGLTVSKAGALITSVVITYQVKLSGTDAEFEKCKITSIFNDGRIDTVGTEGEDIQVKDKVKVEVDRTDEDCSVPEEFPETGPVEIVMAIVVILGIGAGGFYLYRTRKTLKTVETAAKGEEPAKDKNEKDTPAEQ